MRRNFWPPLHTHQWIFIYILTSLSFKHPNPNEIFPEHKKSNSSCIRRLLWDLFETKCSHWTMELDPLNMFSNGALPKTFARSSFESQASLILGRFWSPIFDNFDMPCRSIAEKMLEFTIHANLEQTQFLSSYNINIPKSLENESFKNFWQDHRHVVKLTSIGMVRWILQSCRWAI